MSVCTINLRGISKAFGVRQLFSGISMAVAERERVGAHAVLPLRVDDAHGAGAEPGHAVWHEALVGCGERGEARSCRERRISQHHIQHPETWRRAAVPEEVTESARSGRRTQ